MTSHLVRPPVVLRSPGAWRSLTEAGGPTSATLTAWILSNPVSPEHVLLTASRAPVYMGLLSQFATGPGSALAWTLPPSPWAPQRPRPPRGPGLGGLGQEKEQSGTPGPTQTRLSPGAVEPFTCFDSPQSIRAFNWVLTELFYM